ncbi:hypothetical protein Ddc_21827 [Ditylenchus destructor]|nr:hypothetical protein Ddc_21827 [Ditylenchus destructor]
MYSCEAARRYSKVVQWAIGQLNTRTVRMSVFDGECSSSLHVVHWTGTRHVLGNRTELIDVDWPWTCPNNYTSIDCAVFLDKYE